MREVTKLALVVPLLVTGLARAQDPPPPLETSTDGVVATAADTAAPTESAEAGAAQPAPAVDLEAVLSSVGGAGKCAQSNSTTVLKSLGIASLGAAMEDSEGKMDKGARADAAGMKMRLHQSTECLGKALRLAPDDYVARLALGVTYLMLAKAEYKRGNAPGGHDYVPGANWGMYISAAKAQLGRAYMLRMGNYEPLYYLAEVAVEMGEFDTARAFLKPLQDAGYKRGPVLALQGFILEWTGRPDDAEKYYQLALQSGWPFTTFTYALDRLAERQRQRERAQAGQQVATAQPQTEVAK